MFRIGEFSKMTKTTIKTLRYYDEMGLLKPAFIDEENGYRFYTTEQLLTLHKTVSLRQAGLSVGNISAILSGGNAENILLDRKAEIENLLSQTRGQLSAVNFILSKNMEDEFMNYQAVIKETPECVVYSKKFKVEHYSDLGKAIPAIGEQISKKYPDLKCAIPEYCFIKYTDGEYKESDISVEFCEAVDKIRPNFDDIEFKKLPSATIVSILHKGSYANLSVAYAFIFKWAEQNGYTVVDNPRECYIDGIWNKDSEEEWLTEIQVPVKK